MGQGSVDLAMSSCERCSVNQYAVLLESFIKLGNKAAGMFLLESIAEPLNCCHQWDAGFRDSRKL